MGGIGRAIANGDQVYWVCPLVGESESLDLAAAEERYEQLRSIFGDRVGLVHGKLAGRDKDAAMERFSSGETKILVSTTVIEVGVDVPNATHHGDRARGAVRPGAAPPVARPHRTRLARLHLPAALQGPARTDRAGAARDDARNRGRLPHRRGGSAPEGRRRGAGHAAIRPARLQARAARNPTATCWPPPATTHG